ELPDLPALPTRRSSDLTGRGRSPSQKTCPADASATPSVGEGAGETGDPPGARPRRGRPAGRRGRAASRRGRRHRALGRRAESVRSEEHTSELQSLAYLV